MKKDGIIDVFAETEDEARDIANCYGIRYVNDSNFELGKVTDEKDINEWVESIGI
ncbi:MAG: hypothetical protein J6U90_03785 [Methanobrevibacter sp.]|nr:hypothetical protein [Methanobrevibacter sp.]